MLISTEIYAFCDSVRFNIKNSNNTSSWENFKESKVLNLNRLVMK